jgi:hypothetical protein
MGMLPVIRVLSMDILQGADVLQCCGYEAIVKDEVVLYRKWGRLIGAGA